EGNAAQIVDRSAWILIALSLLIVLVVPLVIWLIVRAFTRPLGHTVHVIEAVAAGDVDQEIEYSGRDEVGALASACRNLIEYTRAAAAAADAVSRGDLTARIVVRSERDVLSRNFVRAIESLRGVVGETNKLIQAARDGNLDQRGDASLYEGAYSELVRGVNETLDATTAPINEAAAVLEQVAAGDLTVRVKGDYRG